MAQLGSSKVFGNLQVTGNIVAGTTITGTTLSISGTATAVTFSGALSGNATTATALQTARTINLVSFNGSQNITLTKLYSIDDRTLAPADTNTRYMEFGFGAWNNNNTGPFADFLNMRSYSDSSGGNDNVLMLRKDTIGMRIYQQSFGSTTAYASYRDVAFTDSPTFTGQVVVAAGGVSITGGVTVIGTDITIRNGIRNINIGTGSNVFSTRLGYQALNVSTGDENVAIGYDSMLSNTTGNYNVAVGAQSNRVNTTNNYNTAIGYNSMYNQSGSKNVALGANSLQNGTGGFNTAIGIDTFTNLTSGSTNVGVGYWSLISTTSGSNNIGVGYNSGGSITTGSNNTVIGSLAGSTNMSSTVLVGAGTTERLKVNSTGLYVNQSTNNLNDALAIAWLGL